MKNILIISFSNLKRDPRVQRQISFLKNKYKLITAGYGDPEVENVQYLSLIPKPKINYIKLFLSVARILTHQYETYYWQKDLIVHCLEVLKDIKVDLIIVNDVDPLPIAFRISQKAKVIFDAHEYAPLEYEESLFFKILRQNYVTYLCQTYIPKVDGMITVAQTIAETYEKDTGVKPSVLTNAPEYIDIAPKLTNNNNEKIKLIHHGGAAPSRKIENMIKMMDYLDDRFQLNLILVEGNKKYIQYLKKIANKNSNINFLTPVPMKELSKHLNNYDMGIYILEPNSFNNLYALPNKFFEFIQGRLGIAIAPSPEMARIVKQYNCGVVAKDFSPQSLAQCLMELDHQKINYFKQQSHKIAHLMSAENNKDILLNMVSKVLEE